MAQWGSTQGEASQCAEARVGQRLGEDVGHHIPSGAGNQLHSAKGRHLLAHGVEAPAHMPQLARCTVVVGREDSSLVVLQERGALLGEADFLQEVTKLQGLLNCEVRADILRLRAAACDRGLKGSLPGDRATMEMQDVAGGGAAGSHIAPPVGITPAVQHEGAVAMVEYGDA